MNQYSRELFHHGTIGMKWGIRRYQPYGVGYDTQHPGKYIGKIRKSPKAKDYQKALNKIERAGVVENAKARIAAENNNRYLRRWREAHAKDPNSKRTKNLREKVNRAYDRVAEDHPKALRTINDEFNRVLKDAMDQGYDVIVREKKEYVETGNRFLDFWLDSATARKLSPERVINVGRFTVKKSKAKNPAYMTPWNQDKNIFAVYRKEDLFNNK